MTIDIPFENDNSIGFMRHKTGELIFYRQSNGKIAALDYNWDEGYANCIGNDFETKDDAVKALVLVRMSPKNEIRN